MDGYVAFKEDVIKQHLSVLEALHARLNDTGKIATKDIGGNVVYVESQIFTNDTLLGYIKIAEMQLKFHCIGLSKEATEAYLYQGALVAALAAKALQERGREYTIDTGGIHMTPPNVSEILMTQYHAELAVFNQMKVQLQ